MKSKKIISLALALIMAFAMFVVAVPTASAVTNEVSLIYAKSDSYISGWGGYGSYSKFARATGFIEVENLGYNKNISVHYSFDGTTWYDVAAEYYCQTWGNKEAWSFTTGYSSAVDAFLSVGVTFAIKYEVNGQTYWDNNNGQNYSVETIDRYGYPEKVAFGSGALFVDKFSTYNNTLRGEIKLNNLAYNKTVQVRYTTDGWNSYTVLNAQYGHGNSNDNTETWNFESSQLPADWSELEFAVSYTVNGVTYWDNNFGANYKITQ